MIGTEKITPVAPSQTSVGPVGTTPRAADVTFTSLLTGAPTQPVAVMVSVTSIVDTPLNPVAVASIKYILPSNDLFSIAFTPEGVMLQEYLEPEWSSTL